MKICITSSGNNLDSNIDLRFGRCLFFLIVDTETLEFEAIENAYLEATGGAGVQAGQLMINKKVKVVLTGHVGPNAFQVLSSAGIEILTVISGTVKEVIVNYKQERYQTTTNSTVNSKFGITK